jgi:hypothetical protein
VFAVCAGDNGPVYGARQLQPDAVDVRFADVRVEDAGTLSKQAAISCCIRGCSLTWPSSAA